MLRSSIKTPELPHNSARGAVSIREFANGDSISETSRKQLAPLLVGKDLVRSVLGLAEEDQTTFIDNVQQVCRYSWPSVPKALIHSSYKGIPHHRLAKCKIAIHLWGHVQRNKAPSKLGCTLGRARDVRQRSLCVQNLCGHVARKVPWDTGLHQSPSIQFHQRRGGGEGGKRPVNAGGLSLN